MKGWIAAVLAVTFLSGTSTGYLIGASAMLLLLIYPLRKRLASLRWIGSKLPALLSAWP